MKNWFACVLVVLASGCPNVQTDPEETENPGGDGPIVEFDPSNRIVPFPNNLLLDPATGKVNLPAQCNESAAAKATRENVINKLDGFGTFETAMSVTFSAPVDAATLTDRVVMYKRTEGMTAETATPIPVVLIPGTTTRFDATCMNPATINSLTIVPRVPLEQKSTYVVALLAGIKSDTGEDLGPSFTWSLIRQEANPVTLDDNGNVVSDRTPLDPASPDDANGNGVGDDLEQLRGIDLLWRAHAQALAFLMPKHPRGDVLLAWEFRTQTTTDALDPTVSGTPTTMLNDVALTGPADNVPVPISVVTALNITAARTAAMYPFNVCNTGVPTVAPPEPNDVQCFLKLALGGGLTCTSAQTCATPFATGNVACSIVGCANIGDVLLGRVSSPQFQQEVANAAVPTMPIPGAWSDPVKPTKVKDTLLGVTITVPTGTAPAAGWSTAVFQHGLGRSRNDILAIGGRLATDPDAGGTAASGIATVAIDAVAHGSRLVPINTGGTCATAPTAACFAGFISSDLGGTRDNIRQTVVDHHQLVHSLERCTGGAANCGAFRVDAASIVYIGQSLGGILGSMTTATNTDISAAVLNVPGVGWIDMLENTQTLALQCTLVDALIDAGTLTGAKSDLTADPPTGLCTTDDWKTQPGYRQFSAIGRWVLDPADPANFTRLLAQRRFLIQEVVGDTVVPNIATTNEGMLVGLTAMMATPAASLAPAPSAAITTNPTTSKWVRYMNLAPDAGTGFPGNTYNHGSLLSPAPSVTGMQCNPGTGVGCDGVIGTARMITDAIAFLQLNK